MKLLSFHSNQSTSGMAIVEANALNISVKFQRYPLYNLWGIDFWLFSANFACKLPWQPIKFRVWTKMICLVEDYSRNISVKNCQIICNEIAISTSFHSSHYKSMSSLSCHSNHSSYQIGTKNLFICTPGLKMRNLVRISFTASEQMLFEIVDGQCQSTTLMPGYTICSPMSLRRRWADIIAF